MIENKSLNRLLEYFFLVTVGSIIGLVFSAIFLTEPPWDKNLTGGTSLRTLRQSLPYTCGPTALVMTASAWGIEVDESQLAILAKTTRRGTSMFSLYKTGKEIGLDLVGMRLSFNDLKKANKPLIAHVNGNHFVVVEDADDKHVIIADPANGGNIKLTGAEFSKIWQGNSLVVIGKGNSSFVTNWLISGPYDQNTPFDLNAILAKDSKFSWHKISQPRFSGRPPIFIDLIQLLGQVEYVSAYALTYVYSPFKRKVQFRLGSDDGVLMWLNGECILNVDVQRPLHIDQNIVEAKLRRGWNSILLKISQARGEWGFVLRITDELGRNCNDLKINFKIPTE